MAKRIKSTCRHCGKPIRFVRSEDKIIPCEKRQSFVKPNPYGDIFFRANGTRIIGCEEEDGYIAYEPHQCPLKLQ